MRTWLLFVFVIITFISCNHKEREKYIPRKDLIPLLVDMHIADALAVNRTINNQFKSLDSSLVYSSVLNKHGYSKNELVKTMEYYTTKPEKLAKIYDEVFSELSRKSEKLKATRDKYSYSNSDNVWKSTNSRYRITGREAMYPKAFEFPIDSLGTYIINVLIKITDEDSSINARMIAYFFSPENDVPEKRLYFKKTPIPKSNYPREYTLVKKCKDSSLTHMRIIIPEYENEDSTFYKQADISNLRVRKLKKEEE